MAETLSNTGEQASETPKSTRWDELKDIPFSGEKHSEGYETELTSPSDVLNDTQKFAIKNGKIYSRETGQEESDEDTVLRVKTSRFLFNEAKNLRDEQAQMFGDRFVDKGPDYYVDRIMDRYGFKNEDTKFAEGKLLKNLVDNGFHHQAMLGDNLTGSKYGMFVGEKGDLGKALLKRRLKQHGLDMASIKVDIDSSTFKKDGYSTVDIKVDTAPITKAERASSNPNSFSHPAAEQLSKLEAELIKAQEEGDEETARGYRAALKMVVERNRLEVSPKDWDNMDDEQKERFYKLKMKEEKILGDKDAFNFWNANLQRLKNKSQGI